MNPFFKSFTYAAHGVVVSFRVGRNFKVMVAIACVALVLGWALAISPLEWAAVIICIGCVLGAECINTAIEAAVDLMTSEHKPLAGRAKDCAAAASLVLSCASVGVAACIFLPKLVALFT